MQLALEVEVRTEQEVSQIVWRSSRSLVHSFQFKDIHSKKICPHTQVLLVICNFTNSKEKSKHADGRGSRNGVHPEDDFLSAQAYDPFILTIAQSICKRIGLPSFNQNET